MSKISDEARKLFDRGLSLRFTDQDAAFQALYSALKLDPSIEGLVEGIVGSTLWSNGFPKDAIAHLKRATEIKPKARGSSIALFHSFIDLGMVKEAIEEANRFFKAIENDTILMSERIQEYWELYRPFIDLTESEIEVLSQKFKTDLKNSP